MKSKHTIAPVLLAGGEGKRLWPLSSSSCPKPFVTLPGMTTSLFEQTLERVNAPLFSSPLLSLHEEQRFLAEEMVERIWLDSYHMILEPFRKNTAPSATLAALYLRSVMGEDALMCLLPADQYIPETDSWLCAMEKTVPSALQGHIVTVGITPSHPAEGYGYIHIEESPDDHGAYSVAAFIEKPDVEKAESLWQQPFTYWNSGVFVCSVKTWLEEVERFCPEILAACQEAYRYRETGGKVVSITPRGFMASPPISIDYAVMEHTKNATLVPFSGEWEDMGSWQALWNRGEKDPHNNVVSTPGSKITHTSNSYLYSEKGKTLCTLGVDNLLVAVEGDKVLVADKTTLAQSPDWLHEAASQYAPRQSPFIFRPWGKYELLHEQAAFRIKKLTVNPGGKLSLQLHQHRSEHWTVLSGTAEVRRGEESFTLRAGQSIDIPTGVRHRLENNGENPLEVIEIQSGHYLDESDIVRFDDVYGRINQIA